MKILSIFIIISILIVTIISSSVQPKLHKHFLIAPANFKLENADDFWDDMQSVSLFKIGNVNPINSVPQEKIADKNINLPPEEVKIIPSSFIDTMNFQDGHAVSKNVEQPGKPKDSNEPAEENNSNEVLQQVENMLNSELDNDSHKQEKPDQQIKPGQTCSVCDKLKDPKYREELIAWNAWRSKIQNWVMMNSEIEEATMGTIFYFTFTVDKYRNIKDLRIFCTNKSFSKDVKNVRSAILSLKGKSILEFPKGSNRDKITFAGGFLLSNYSQLSSPSDFNDIEHVLRSYY